MEPLSGGMKVAVYIITLIFIYFGGVTAFSKNVDKETTDIITTYLQTILTVMISYYWGNSSAQRHINDAFPDDTAKKAAAEIETKRIEAAKQDAADKETARIDIAKETGAKVIEEATTKSQEETT